MEIATRRREQEVWQACDDLWAMHGDLKSMTGDAIRDRLVTLGKSKGSPNEIYRYKKTWASSRRVSDETSRSDQDDDGKDPIGRAVRLVHEKLKSETREEISRVQQEYLEQIEQKDSEISEAKRSLDDLMIEYQKLEQQNQERSLNIAALTEQLAVEIKMREATERELINTRALNEQEKNSLLNLVNELKNLRKQDQEQARQREEQMDKAGQEKVNKLLAEQKLLGFEFSDKIAELKTEIYNQKIVNERHEKHGQELKQGIIDQRGENDFLKQKIELLTTENVKLASILEAAKRDCQGYSQEALTLKKELKKNALMLKRAELSLARLRAIFRSR